LKLSVIVVVAEYGTAEPTEPRQCTPAASVAVLRDRARAKWGFYSPLLMHISTRGTVTWSVAAEKEGRVLGASAMNIAGKTGGSPG